MSDTVKRIKELTKSLTDDASQLAKQAEAGFKSQWMSVDDSGEAKWGGTPGIYYGTVGLPALADLAKEGTAPEWAKNADEKAAKIRQAVEQKMKIEEPKGFPQHLARAAGEMVAQVPVPGAMLNKLRTVKLAANEAPSLKRKIALAPVEYFSPIVEVSKAKPTAINYGVGTAFGGGLGYGIEKLTEEEKPSLKEMINKYGPNYGYEVRDVSKPAKFSKGGDVEDKEELSKLEELTAKYAYAVEKQRKYNTGKNTGREDEVVKPRRFYDEKTVNMPGDFQTNTIKTPLGDRVVEKFKQYNMPEYREEDVPLKKYLRYYAGGGKATKLKQGRSAFFSAVDNAIATLKQEKGTPEQMMSLIEKTPGVKKEELERRNIRKKLEGKKSITRTELEEIARQNPAQAPSITRLKAEPKLSDILERAKEATGLDDLALNNIATKLEIGFNLDRHSGFPNLRIHSINEPTDQYYISDLYSLAADYKEFGQITDAEYTDLVNDIRKLDSFTKNDNKRILPKYKDYALKGGSDYQEVIMSMPTKIQRLLEFAKVRGITEDPNNVALGVFPNTEKAWVEEYGQRLPDDELIGHWRDVPVENYTVHYRTQTFTDKDGKKVLHVEEIQSDPHQRARDLRKQEVKKRSTNEHARRVDRAVKQLEEDPDYLPEGFEYIGINDDQGIGLLDTRTGEVLGHRLFGDLPDEDGIALALKKDFKTPLRSAIREQTKLSDDEIKAIAKEVPEDFGYMTPEKQLKAQEIKKNIQRISRNGLSVDEIEEYFQPGRIIKSWAGTDKVIDFTRGPKVGSDEWLKEYDDGLQWLKQEYPNQTDEQYHEMATNIANGRASDWSVKVVEIDPRTGQETGRARLHSTSPEEAIIRDLRQQEVDLGGVVSDLPYKKTYDELALKQIIDDAVNQGYDRVSISPGLFQVDRYESAIRSRIDGIRWGEMTPEGRMVSFVKDGRDISDAVVNEDGIITAGPGDWMGEPLKSVIGEDMASKINATSDKGEFSGEGLTVGAKGFTEFYDKRLPNFLKEYLRKEFGTDVGRTEFEYGEGKKAKSRTEIYGDLHDRYMNDELTPDEQDAIQELEIDKFYDIARQTARAHGLEFDAEAELKAFNEEYPFQYVREQSIDRALTDFTVKLYKEQPAVKPVADVFSFDVTPQMSEKVKGQGQRLFAAAPVVALPMVQDDEDKRKVSPSYTIAPEAKTPTLNPQEEQQFQSDVRGTDWFSKFKEKFGEEPNLEDKEYNYRAAWQSGARPQAIEQDDIPHWPSVTSSGESLKARSHPSGWMEDYTQITGRDPSEGGDLTPEQTEAMNKSLMYRYGFAGGGKVDKLKQVMKKMQADTSPQMSKPQELKSSKQRFLSPSKEKRVMYHGTHGDIFAFNPGQANAIFVSDSPETATHFAELREHGAVLDMANEVEKNPQAKRDLLIPIIDQAIADGRLGTPENTNGLVKTTREKHIEMALQKQLGDQLGVVGYGKELYQELQGRMPSSLNIMPLYVKTENPFDYENPEHVDAVMSKVKEILGEEGYSKDRMSSGDWPAIEDETVQEAIKDLGFDGFYVEEGGNKNLGIYNPNRIKSAIGNRGTYDIEDADITKAKGGVVRMAGGGKADKMKQVLKKMGVDESKVASKDLTTLQDVHTSLGDSIRERAAKMRQQMDEMQFKYEPGQHVFTESTARKNLPPLKILRKTMVGNQPVREPHPDYPIMGKVVKDPETGKTLRTPYEPGYKVRHERGEDDWAEFDISESVIKGAIDEFAKGGIAKKIREVRQKIADQSGEYNAKRLDRAADEVKNLGQTFSDDALRRAFLGDNTTGLVIVDPGKYETFAARLPRKGYDEDVHGASPQYRIGDKLVNYDEYVKYLQGIAQTTGFSDVPYLNLNKRDKDALLYISGHEGRHRQRALSGLGDSKSLVRIEPRAAIREPIERRTKEQGIEGLKAAIQNKPVMTEQEEIIILPEVFKRGGSV